MNEILPGILEQSWEAIERKLQLLKPFVNTIHIDVIDGIFAPNKTFLEPTPFAPYANDYFFEAHLMVEDPLAYLKPLSEVGFKRFLGHIERMPDQAAFVAEGQRLGEVGLFVDGPTGLEKIRVPLEDLDALGIFTAHRVGYSGQPFEEEKLKKVQEIRTRNILNYKGLPLPVEVDGGINEETLSRAKKAGATRFVCTSGLFGSDDLVSTYKKLQALE